MQFTGSDFRCTPPQIPPSFDNETLEGTLEFGEFVPDPRFEGFSSLKHKKLIQKLSPDLHKRILGCGSHFLEFRSKSSKYPYYWQSACHSQFCPICARSNQRKASRLIRTLGEELIGFCSWYSITATLPKKVRKKYFLNEKALSKFEKDVYEICISELGLWKDLDRFDRSGGITSLHWFGDEESTYHPHANVLIPCIQNGEAVDAYYGKEEFKELMDSIKKRLAERLTNTMSGEVELTAKEMNVHIEIKDDVDQTMHAIRYLVRNTSSLGDIPFQHFAEEDGEVQEFLTQGRVKKCSYRYRGKLAGGELKKWYEYLGLDYESRNSSATRGWFDSDGGELKFKKISSGSYLKANGEVKEFFQVSKRLFTHANDKAISEKFNDDLSSNLDRDLSGKDWKRKVEKWQKLLGDKRVNWSEKNIQKSLEKENFVLSHPNICSAASLVEIEKETKSKRENDREEKEVKTCLMDGVLVIGSGILSSSEKEEDFEDRIETLKEFSRGKFEGSRKWCGKRKKNMSPGKKAYINLKLRKLYEKGKYQKLEEQDAARVYDELTGFGKRFYEKFDVFPVEWNEELRHDVRSFFLEWESLTCLDLVHRSYLRAKLILILNIYLREWGEERTLSKNIEEFREKVFAWLHRNVDVEECRISLYAQRNTIGYPPLSESLR